MTKVGIGIRYNADSIKVYIHFIFSRMVIISIAPYVSKSQGGVFFILIFLFVNSMYKDFLSYSKVLYTVVRLLVFCVHKL